MSQFSIAMVLQGIYKHETAKMIGAIIVRISLPDISCKADNEVAPSQAVRMGTLDKSNSCDCKKLYAGEQVVRLRQNNESRQLI